MTINWTKWASARFSTIFTIWHRWQSQLNKISFTRKVAQNVLFLCQAFQGNLETPILPILPWRSQLTITISCISNTWAFCLWHTSLSWCSMLTTHANHTNQLNICSKGVSFFFLRFLGKEPFDTGWHQVGKKGGKSKTKLRHKGREKIRHFKWAFILFECKKLFSAKSQGKSEQLSEALNTSPLHCR